MSLYNDNQSKFVAVLNKKIPMPKLFNALAHITAGIISLYKGKDVLEFLEYKDGDNTLHPAISKYPFIILGSDNGNQIRTLRKTAIEQSILYNDFTDSMLGSSAEEQMQQTLSKKESELEYYAIVLFATAEKLNPLTKRFSLFYDPHHFVSENVNKGLMFH